MPDDPLAGGQAWINAWADAQRAAVDQWLGRGDTRAGDGVRDALAGWWRLWGSQAGPHSGQAGETLQALGAQYLKLFEQTWAGLGDQGRLNPSGSEFQDRLQRWLGDALSGAAARELQANWAALVPGLGAAAPRPGAHAWPEPGRFAAAAPWQALFEVPLLGPAREQHAEWLRFNEALTAHQRLAADFLTLVGGVHQQALELLREKVAARSREGKPVTTFREFYDLWVACGEEAFAQVAYSDRYTRLQGALGDSDAKLRVQLRGLLERWLRALDLPTRPELDTAHRRVHELGKRLAALERTQSAAADDAVRGLAERVNALETEVGRLRAGRRRPPATRRNKEAT